MFARVSEVIPNPRARSFQTTTRRTTMFVDSIAGGAKSVSTHTSSSLFRRKQSSISTSWLLQMSTPSLFSRADCFTLRTTTCFELCIATTHAGASRMTIPSTRMSWELPRPHRGSAPVPGQRPQVQNPASANLHALDTGSLDQRRVNFVAPPVLLLDRFLCGGNLRPQDRAAGINGFRPLFGRIVVTSCTPGPK